MKKIKKLLNGLLVVQLVVTGVCLEVPAITIQAQTITISKKKVTIRKDSTVQLKIFGTERKVKWTSSNKKIAVINQKGKVTAKKKGKATITAKVGEEICTCKVTVIGKHDYNTKVTEKNVRSALQVPTDVTVKIKYGKKYYRESFGRYLVYVSISGIGKYEGYMATGAFDVYSGEIESEIFLWYNPDV